MSEGKSDRADGSNQNDSEVAGSTAVQRLRDAIGDTDIADEQSIWEGGYSGKSMTGTFILAGLVSLLLLVLVAAVSFLRDNRIAWYGLVVVLLLLWLVPAFIVAYRKLAQRYELTTQRLKHRDGILIRNSNRIELIDIDDVMYRQGPIETVMKVGNILVKSSDTSHPELMMRGIADAKVVADMIDDARRAERRKRGLHIETI